MSLRIRKTYIDQVNGHKYKQRKIKKSQKGETEEETMWQRD